MTTGLMLLARLWACVFGFTNDENFWVVRLRRLVTLALKRAVRNLLTYLLTYLLTGHD